MPAGTDDATLCDYARRHVGYELVSLIDLVTELRNPQREVVRRGLLEASLGHLRVLDDFFRLPANRQPTTCPQCSAPQPGMPRDDITAEHYLPGWDRRGVLTGKLRALLNAQLPHLALRRVDGYGWEIGKLAVHACDAFVAFVGQLRGTNALRARWFDAQYQRALQMTVGTDRSAYETMPASTTNSPPMLTVGTFGLRRPSA